MMLTGRSHDVHAVAGIMLHQRYRLSPRGGATGRATSLDGRLGIAGQPTGGSPRRGSPRSGALPRSAFAVAGRHPQESSCVMMQHPRALPTNSPSPVGGDGAREVVRAEDTPTEVAAEPEATRLQRGL